MYKLNVDVEIFRKFYKTLTQLMLMILMDDNVYNDNTGTQQKVENIWNNFPRSASVPSIGL